MAKSQQQQQQDQEVNIEMQMVVRNKRAAGSQIEVQATVVDANGNESWNAAGASGQLMFVASKDAAKRFKDGQRLYITVSSVDPATRQDDDEAEAQDDDEDKDPEVAPER
jgi:hypothetical protein